MIEAERLAERFNANEELASLLVREGLHSGAWFGDKLLEAAALIRSQAEELERLRAEIVALEQITADVQAHGQKGWSKAFQALGDVK